MKSLKIALACATATAALGCAGPLLAQSAKPRPACDIAAVKPPEGVTLTSAKALATPVNYCRLDGYVTTTNPGPNKVHFMLALPETWNGRYLFTVQGGAAGFVPDPTAPNLSDGYAIASTDKGVVTAGGLDFSFMSNPAMKLDWNHRGVHVAAQATEAIARDYYGQPKLNRYVEGCSGGGDGTLTEAEMHPEDFDAYIGGAMNTDWPYGTTLTWAAIGARVNKVPGAWISQDEYNRIYEILLAKYDAADGVVDGLIWDPSVIKLDASDRQALAFLSDAQFGTLQLIRDGVHDAKGNVLAPGFWLDNPSAFPVFLTGRTPPPWKTQAEMPAGYIVADTSSKAREGPNFSFITDLDFSNLPSQSVRGLDPTKFDHHNLAGLQKAGAKLILWVGGAEQAVSEQQILGYTHRIGQTFGKDAQARFQRTFIVPGMHHCGLGANAPTDTVEGMRKAAEAWVEQGKAPDAVVLTNAPPPGQPPVTGMAAMAYAPVHRSYLICAYPTHSTFNGGLTNPDRLDVDDARNWSCKP